MNTTTIIQQKYTFILEKSVSFYNFTVYFERCSESGVLRFIRLKENLNLEPTFLSMVIIIMPIEIQPQLETTLPVVALQWA